MGTTAQYTRLHCVSKVLKVVVRLISVRRILRSHVRETPQGAVLNTQLSNAKFSIAEIKELAFIYCTRIALEAVC
jgi:hypothetical protein